MALAEVPTLVKYADAVEYLAKIPQTFAEEAACLPERKRASREWCQLVALRCRRRMAGAGRRPVPGWATSYAQALETIPEGRG